MKTPKNRDVHSKSDDNVADICETISDGLRHANDYATHYIRENPLKSLGISLLTGALIASAIRHRNNKK